jgi:CBS domain-containing protein
MNVETILRAKGRQVATIAPDASVEEALTQLAKRAIGALVVSDDGASVDGILSERDIVRSLAEHGTALLRMRVEELMTTRVFTCTPKDTIDELMGLMTERRIRHLPVTENNRLVGIVSIGDIVKNRLEEVEYEATSMRSFISGA